MADELIAKVFWSGGSQAVRLPKALRFATGQVSVRRRGKAVVLEPIETSDDWDGFWDQLRPLNTPVRRWGTRKAERRKAL